MYYEKGFYMIDNSAIKLFTKRSALDGAKSRLLLGSIYGRKVLLESVGKQK